VEYNDPFEDFFSDPFGGFFGRGNGNGGRRQRQVQTPKRTAAGSGVIITSDGYIVTNNHVIEGAREILVSLSDGRSVKGKLIGADELTDIAVVKIDETDLPTASFGNSDEIVVGEPAIAIGNPMGLEFQGSVTVGVISAMNRTLSMGGERQL
jgi:S1-C subfamily serine protease